MRFSSVELLRNAILTYRCIRLLGYGDDTDIIGCIKRDVTAVFGSIEKKSDTVRLVVNIGKTKFMVCSNRKPRVLDSHLTAES